MAELGDWNTDFRHRTGQKWAAKTHFSVIAILSNNNNEQQENVIQEWKLGLVGFKQLSDTTSNQIIIEKYVKRQVFFLVLFNADETLAVANSPEQIELVGAEEADVWFAADSRIVETENVTNLIRQIHDRSRRIAIA